MQLTLEQRKNVVAVTKRVKTPQLCFRVFLFYIIKIILIIFTAILSILFYGHFVFFIYKIAVSIGSFFPLGEAVK